MPEFDPMRMYSYTASEIADFIDAGQISKEELYANGYPASKRPDLENELARRAAEKAARERLPIEDDEMWQWARRQNAISAYEKYLRKYDTFGEGEYKGKYVFDARAAIEDLQAEAVRLREELFDAMKRTPWVFKADTIRALVNGIDDMTRDSLRGQSDVASRFLVTGQTVSFDEIRKAGVVPDSWKLETIIAPDFALQQINIQELGDFPTEGRTDVFFLGVPRGGKSSVLAGIFHEMFRRGQVTYEPQFNAQGMDLGNAYFKGLIKSVGNYKFPVSTQTDSISFMKLKLSNNNRENPLTFVEIAGEAFKQIANGISTGREVWEELGAAQCLKSKNRKFLAFIVDYSIAKGDVREDGNLWNDIEQALVLDDALTVLGHDGHGNGGETDCTMSKVDTVAVIVTKSDLMGDNLTRDQRMQVAQSYIADKFSNFMNNLQKACRKYGINSPIGYQPYILTFSLGKLRVGNTFEYDPTDSANIIDFISSSTTTVSQGLFGRLFGR